MNIPALQKRLRDFAAARDWQTFHTPKNLAMALMVEAAELLELFQWLTTAESHTLTKAEDDKERVSDEIADVLLYLLQLADHTGVDVEEAVERKLRKNAEKHPAKHTEKPVPESAVHVFVDWENVQPNGGELRELVPGASQVWLFHGPSQKVDASSHRQTLGSGEVTLVQRSGSGRNALDFQLSYYIGYVSSRHPQAQFVVVANDTGYDPMLEHARELGFEARRCGFQRVAAPLPVPPKPVAKKVRAKNGSPLISAVPPLTPPVPAAPTAAQIAWRAIKQSRRMASTSKPDDMQAFLESLIHEQVRDKADLARRAAALIEIREQNRFITQAIHQPAEPSATSASPAPVQAPAFPSAPGIQQAVAEKALGSKGTSVQASANQGAKAKAAPSPAQVAHRVLSSLKKMPNNKPMRKAGLLKHIETHLGMAPDRAARAQTVFALMANKKQVVLSKDGLRVSYPKLK